MALWVPKVQQLADYVVRGHKDHSKRVLPLFERLKKILSLPRFQKLELEPPLELERELELELVPELELAVQVDTLVVHNLNSQ